MTPPEHALSLLVPATDNTFDETAYLKANPDVADLVERGDLSTGRVHYQTFGRVEQRQQRREIPHAWKHRKLGRVRPLLRADAPCRETLAHIDCLTDAMREQFRIVPTTNISQHDYDHEALALIERHTGGLVLDCGAGCRNTYYDNVVNFEVVAYDSTDVLGVAEQLPFKDASFDAVLSLNVLEHLKNPFLAAQEIMRVLKPGGELLCVAPFLQPLHGYPHHYYNMTATGLENLFEPLVDRRILIHGAMQPIWALNWILRSYAAGLPDDQRERFKGLTVADLLTDPIEMETDPIVLMLAHATRTELASAHALLARKSV